MEHAFSRILAILTAAVMFFIVPVVINMQRQENLIQLSIMQDTVQLVDSVRNMGVLTEDMLKRYENQIRQMQSGLEIYMVHTTESLSIEEEHIEQVSVLRTESDIRDSLEHDGTYEFQKGDYFRVEVRKKISGYSQLLYQTADSSSETNRAVYAYYGGSIRYED